MKCRQPNSDQSAEFTVLVNGDVCAEFACPQPSVEGINTMECIIPVREDDMLTIRGTFEGTIGRACFDLIADGSFVCCKNIERGRPGEVKFSERTIVMREVYDMPERCESSPATPGARVVLEGNLNVEELSQYPGAMNGSLLGIGSLAVIVSACGEPDEIYEHGYDNCTLRSWKKRDDNEKFGNGGIPPSYQLGILTTRREAPMDLQMRHKRQFQRARIGSERWATFIFYYRHSAAIEAAGCVERDDAIHNLAPAADSGLFYYSSLHPLDQTHSQQSIQFPAVRSNQIQASMEALFSSDKDPSVESPRPTGEISSPVKHTDNNLMDRMTDLLADIDKYNGQHEQDQAAEHDSAHPRDIVESPDRHARGANAGVGSTADEEGSRNEQEITEPQAQQPDASDGSDSALFVSQGEDDVDPVEQSECNEPRMPVPSSESSSGSEIRISALNLSRPREKASEETLQQQPRKTMDPRLAFSLHHTGLIGTSVPKADRAVTRSEVLSHIFDSSLAAQLISADEIREAIPEVGAKMKTLYKRFSASRIPMTEIFEQVAKHAFLFNDRYYLNEHRNSVIRAERSDQVQAFHSNAPAGSKQTEDINPTDAARTHDVAKVRHGKARIAHQATRNRTPFTLERAYAPEMPPRLRPKSIENGSIVVLSPTPASIKTTSPLTAMRKSFVPSRKRKASASPPSPPPPRGEVAVEPSPSGEYEGLFARKVALKAEVERKRSLKKQKQLDEDRRKREGEERVRVEAEIREIEQLERMNAELDDEIDMLDQSNADVRNQH